MLAAIEKGFGAIGFSSHAMLPEDDTSWVLTPEKAPRYAAEIRSLAKKYEGRIRILCGVEADYVPGGATPDRRAYAAISPDYIIGSVHFVVAPDGARVCVDESPESLEDGIRRHFGGDTEAYLHAYFAQVRKMLLSCDFDVVGHLDLVRKFNTRHPYFDETAPWSVRRLPRPVARARREVHLERGRPCRRCHRLRFRPIRQLRGVPAVPPCSRTCNQCVRMKVLPM